MNQSEDEGERERRQECKEDEEVDADVTTIQPIQAFLSRFIIKTWFIIKSCLF